MAGIAYTLPMLFPINLKTDGNDTFRLQFGKEEIP